MPGRRERGERYHHFLGSDHSSTARFGVDGLRCAGDPQGVRSRRRCLNGIDNDAVFPFERECVGDPRVAAPGAVVVGEVEPVGPEEHEIRVEIVGDEIDDELAIGDFTAPGGAWVRAYELVGTAGNTVTVDLTSDAFDALLILIGPGLAELVFDDDGAGACNARITITFPEDGSYRILASTFAPETGGAFTLRAAAEPGPVDPTACDG